MVGERAALDTLGATIDGEIVAALWPLSLRLVAALRTGGRGALTPARVAALGALAAAALGRIFATSPGAAFAGTEPRTPFAQVLAGGVRAAARLAVPDGADGDAALARATTWRDPNGHILSERVWRNGQEIRERLDTLLDRHLQAGTDPRTVADEVARFLTSRHVRGRARAEGEDGRYAARRLALHEINRAHGQATIALAGRTGAAVRWQIAGAHPAADACDRLARADNHGLGAGVYPAGQVPGHPQHVGCRCVLNTVRAPAGRAGEAA